MLRVVVSFRNGTDVEKEFGRKPFGADPIEACGGRWREAGMAGIEQVEITWLRHEAEFLRPVE